MTRSRGLDRRFPQRSPRPRRRAARRTVEHPRDEVPLEQIERDSRATWCQLTHDFVGNGGARQSLRKAQRPECARLRFHLFRESGELLPAYLRAATHGVDVTNAVPRRTLETVRPCEVQA